MDNTFGKVIDILIAVILMFVFPLLYFSLRTDTITQQVVSTKATEIVDTVRTKGYLTKDMYESFLEQLDHTNNIYDVHLEHKELALEPEYRFKTPEEIIGEQDSIWNGENIYHYHPVTTDLPKISDPANTDGMNTETNESILAKAVDGPADPNHVHTDACYANTKPGGEVEKFRIGFNIYSTSSWTGDAINISVCSEDGTIVYFKASKNTDNNFNNTYSISWGSTYEIPGFEKYYTCTNNIADYTTSTAFRWYNILYNYATKLYTEKKNEGWISSGTYYFNVTYDELFNDISEISNTFPLNSENPLLNQFPQYVEAALGRGDSNKENPVRIRYKYTPENSTGSSYRDYNIYNVSDGRLLAKFSVESKKNLTKGGYDRWDRAFNYDYDGNVINSYSFSESGNWVPIDCEGYLWFCIIQNFFMKETNYNNDMTIMMSRDAFLTKLSNQIYEASSKNILNSVISSVAESQLERDLMGFVEASLDNCKVMVPSYSVKDIQLGDKLYKNVILTRTKSEIFTNYLGEIEINIINSNGYDFTCDYTYYMDGVVLTGKLKYDYSTLREKDPLRFNLKGKYYIYEGIEESRIKPTTFSDRNYNYLPPYEKTNFTLEDGSVRECYIQYAGGYRDGITYYVPMIDAFTGYVNKINNGEVRSTGYAWGVEYKWYYSWWNKNSNSWYTNNKSNVVVLQYPRGADYDSIFLKYFPAGDFYVFTGVDMSYPLGEDYYYKIGNNLICSQIVTGITPTHPIQKVYLREPLITTATATFLDGSTKVVLCSADFETNTIVTDKIVTLSYYGLAAKNQTGLFTCPITVTVIPRTKTCPNGHTYNLVCDGSDPGCPYCEGWVRSLVVKTPESGEITIFRGTTLIENGVVLLATYFNGREEILYSGYVDNLDKYYVGTQNVTISYKGMNTTLKVIIKRNLKKCDVCGRYYELYPDDTDPGCPYCRSKVPVFTGNVLKYYSKTYSDEILKELYDGTGVYYFNQGDYLTIDISNRSETFGSRLISTIINSKLANSIKVEYGGAIRDETKASK